MPSLGSGLSLGTISRINNFDFDASSYIISNNISNNALIPNLDNKRSLRLESVPANQSLSQAHSTAFNITGDFSINLWICPSWRTLGASANCVLLSKGAFNSSGWYLQIQNTTLRFNTAVSGATDFTGSAFYYLKSPPNNDYRSRWVMVTIVYDYATTTASLYRDGVLLGSGSCRVPASDTNTFYVGRDNNGNFYDGLMDGLGIWSKKLTTSEISELFNGGLGKIFADFSSSLTTNLTAFWDFDETSGNRSASNTGSYAFTSNNATASSPWLGKLEYVNPQTQINNFVAGLKANNIWTNTIIWPMRSIHNISTGTSLASLGSIGSFPATLTNASGSGQSPVKDPRGVRTYAPDKFVGGVASGGSLSFANDTYSIFSISQVFQTANDDGTQGYHYIYTRTGGAGAPGYRLGTGTQNYTFYSGGSQIELTTTNPLNDWHSITISKNGTATIDTAINRGAYTNKNISAMSFSGTNNGHSFGDQGSYVATGVRCLELLTKQTLTQAQSQALYDLVKPTLGYGLNLP
jgi:hypothetical protein